MSNAKWSGNWRDETWASLSGRWDVIIIGGGITGAGVLREATHQGLKALLVEQRDFAWGTSSRSSKLVHGGLRYLKSGQVGLTRASVVGREQLLEERPGLVDPLGFLLADYEGDEMNRFVYGAGLTIYDLLAMHWSHRYYGPQDFQFMAPYITPEGLSGGFHYQDAQTDDARLVLRLIREATAAGGTALNYIRAEGLLREEHGAVKGVRLRDDVTGRTAEANSCLVINATGAWADFLRAEVGAPPRIRPLRGSHLIFPAWRFPVAQAVSFMHPADGRPVFAFPWEGVTLLGTTDVDCDVPLDSEPVITPDEVAYLMAAVNHRFPALNLTLDDVLGSFSGIRPVIGSGKADPSQESREHAIWEEAGLLTVTGGKLTTFTQIARDALKAADHLIERESGAGESAATDQPADAPGASPADDLAAAEAVLAAVSSLDDRARQRLLGRYGADATELVAAAAPAELEPIPGTVLLWAELRWAARAEGVVHLDDLLLRRVRVGLVLPNGGAEQLPRIRAICRPELGWDNARWEAEEAAYLALWRSTYSLPDARTIPDWRAGLATLLDERQRAAAEARERARVTRRQAGVIALVAALILFLFYWLRPDERAENRVV